MPRTSRRSARCPSPYVRFYLHPDRQLEAQLAAAESRAQALKRMEAEMLDQYADQRGRAQRAQAPRGALVPRLHRAAHRCRRPRLARHTVVLGLPNAGAVDWAPDDAIIEIATIVEQGGQLRRLAPPAVSPAATDWLQRHAAFETMTARALAGTRSRQDVRDRREGLISALAANPMLPTADLAERLVDEILDRSPT